MKPREWPRVQGRGQAGRARSSAARGIAGAAESPESGTGCRWLGYGSVVGAHRRAQSGW